MCRLSCFARVFHVHLRVYESCLYLHTCRVSSLSVVCPICHVSHPSYLSLVCRIHLTLYVSCLCLYVSCACRNTHASSLSVVSVTVCIYHMCVCMPRLPCPSLSLVSVCVIASEVETRETIRLWVSVFWGLTPHPSASSYKIS